MLRVFNTYFSGLTSYIWPCVLNTILTALASQSTVPLGPQFRADASLAFTQQEANPTVWRRAVFWPTTGRA